MAKEGPQSRRIVFAGRNDMSQFDGRRVLGHTGALHCASGEPHATRTHAHACTRTRTHTRMPPAGDHQGSSWCRWTGRTPNTSSTRASTFSPRAMACVTAPAPPGLARRAAPSRRRVHCAGVPRGCRSAAQAPTLCFAAVSQRPGRTVFTASGMLLDARIVLTSAHSGICVMFSLRITLSWRNRRNRRNRR